MYQIWRKRKQIRLNIYNNLCSINASPTFFGIIYKKLEEKTFALRLIIATRHWHVKGCSYTIYILLIWTVRVFKIWSDFSHSLQNGVRYLIRLIPTYVKLLCWAVQIVSSSEWADICKLISNISVLISFGKLSTFTRCVLCTIRESCVCRFVSLLPRINRDTYACVPSG